MVPKLTMLGIKSLRQKRRRNAKKEEKGEKHKKTHSERQNQQFFPPSISLRSKLPDRHPPDLTRGEHRTQKGLIVQDQRSCTYTPPPPTPPPPPPPPKKKKIPLCLQTPTTRAVFVVGGWPHQFPIPGKGRHTHTDTQTDTRHQSPAVFAPCDAARLQASLASAVDARNVRVTSHRLPRLLWMSEPSG